MNGILAMAEGFLDRMTNSRYGMSVNEEYSLGFQQILANDPEFAVSFASLSLDPEDVKSLPVCAWPWYLQWRTRYSDPPSPVFLDALFDSTDDPAVRLRVTLSALSDTSPEVSQGQVPGGLDKIESQWLRRRLIKLTGDETRITGSRDSVAEVLELAEYLLQIGDDTSLVVLGELVSTQWQGRQQLLEAVEEYLTAANLDISAMGEWRTRLNIPDFEPPFGSDGSDRL